MCFVRRRLFGFMVMTVVTLCRADGPPWGQATVHKSCLAACSATHQSDSTHTYICSDTNITYTHSHIVYMYWLKYTYVYIHLELQLFATFNSSLRLQRSKPCLPVWYSSARLSHQTIIGYRERLGLKTKRNGINNLCGLSPEQPDLLAHVTRWWKPRGE